ncbi:MAG: NUDIX hydrolase [Candidatus Aenigmatarchaeota archaeon]
MVVATVDVIIEKGNKIVLVKRGENPFKGKLALPGGHVNYNELVENAALREAKEETNLKVKLVNILGVYSDPKRDPRGHYISTVFIAKIISGKLKAGSDAKTPNFYDPKKLKREDLAFDHFKIIKDYLKYKKYKKTYWSMRR